MSARDALSGLAAGADGALGLRVLFVHQSSDLYGSDRVLLELVQALQAAGGEPIVALPHGGPLVTALAARGIEVHAVSPLQLLKLSRRAMSPGGLLELGASVKASLRTLDTIVAGRRIDRVHSNTLAVLAGALWARRRGVHHLWHVHEIVEHPRAAAWLFPRLVARAATRVICNSNATRSWLLATQPSLAARTQVLWNGVAAAPTGGAPSADPALHSAFRPQGTRLAVGLVGRFNRMKGHAVLLAASELLHAQGLRDFSLVFIGSAPPGQEHFLADLQRRVAVSPLAPRVVIPGFMSDVSKAMQALDIVCVPSIEAEAFGLVAIEAMAASRPVIASACGGLREVLGMEGVGALVAPGDATALANNLRRVLGDPSLRHFMGRAGRQRFEAHFTLAAMNARFLQLLVAPEGMR